MADQIKPGDPVPWFDAKTIAGASTSLGVVAGRWVALCFLHSLADIEAVQTLVELLAEAPLFDDDHLVFYGVLASEPSPAEAAKLAEISHKALGFITDYDGTIARLYGCVGKSCLVMLDPMLRAIGDYPIGIGGKPPAELRKVLRDLPKVDDWAGVPMTAPALIVPGVFEPSVCEFLVDMYDKGASVDSGFMLDKDGKTSTVFNYNLKKRQDLVISDPQVRELMRDRVVRRLLPVIERFFSYKATRMDRYLVSCYDAETGGHFSRHRDNVNAGARHRRFAVSLNLNRDYDGCDLIFPEFGRRVYRAPCGGAVVFSTGALHQVTPVTHGKRYAFIPFLYGEEEAREREANNALLQSGELMYVEGSDRLYPATVNA